MKLFKIIIFLLILIFSFQSWSKADDISDFQVEGMSIGDSALDYFSKKEIKKFLKTYYLKSKKFYDRENTSSKYKTYDGVGFSFKKKDKAYKIYGINGYIFYDSNIKECLSKKDEIEKELNNIFTESEINRYDDVDHMGDYSGKSRQWQTQYLLSKNGGTVSIDCNDWSEELKTKEGYTDNLSITVYSKEYENFIRYEAY